MAENYTIVNDEGEVIAQDVQIEPLSETEAMTVGDLSSIPVGEEANGSKIPPILVKGLVVAAGYAAYRFGKKGYAKIKEKIAESKAEKESGLTPEQRKVAEEAYRMLAEKGLSDTSILYEAQETAKLYEQEEAEKK